ncbi:MAG: cupin domain-containing protein [Pseudomonas sp.]
MNKLVLLLAIAVTMMSIQNVSAVQNGDEISIIRKGTAQHIKGPAKTFTGDVDVEFSIPKHDKSRMSGGLVTFQPGARSHWHTHPFGQVLIITAGEGRVQQWGKPVQDVYPGDVVWFPAGVKHWHGASPTQSMSHYSIQEEKNGKVADWMEEVTDDQYLGR